MSNVIEVANRPRVVGTAAVLFAVMILYLIVRGFLTGQPTVKLSLGSVLLLVQVINLAVNLKSQPRRAFEITMVLLIVETAVSLVFTP